MKQARNLKIKWPQLDSNPQPLTSSTTTQQFSQTDQMIELCCECLSVWYIWLYVFVMSRTCFRVIPHSIIACLNVKEIIAWSRREIKGLSDCNWTQIHERLGNKRTLTYLAKLSKWLSCVVSTYLHGSVDCMFLSRHVRVSERIHTL